jgi:hypothetical protein
MRGRAIDRGDSGKEIADLLEDRIGEDAAFCTDRSQHGRHAEVPCRLCESNDVVHHETGIDRVHGKGNPRLVIDEDHNRVLDGQFVRIRRHACAPRFRYLALRQCKRGSSVGSGPLRANRSV